MLNRLSIRIKLALLAGVPLVGALALAALLGLQAQQSARKAAALGSVEDLAELTGRIGGLVHELQAERALLGLTSGYLAGAEEELDEDVAKELRETASQHVSALQRQVAATDASRAALGKFLEGRDLSAIPARLKRDMELAKQGLEKVGEVRASVQAKPMRLETLIEFYAKVNESLIDATASLTELSDDGDLLRSITALVSVLQVKERASQEHALLANVFAGGQFPAGAYRAFVTLTTQEQVHISVFRSSAAAVQADLYDRSMKADPIQAAAAMRTKALATVDDEFGIAAIDWFKAQGAKILALKTLEGTLTNRVREAALAKIAETRKSIRTSIGVSVGALLGSLLLAWMITRGINQSIGALSGAAAVVQETNDFSTRAAKHSHDELGALSDAFNHMLSGIEKRDAELEDYRHGLEAKVEARTAELSARNAAMRMVLDNVEQGLVTIHQDGTMDRERSAAFDNWFGTPANDTTFDSHLGADDENVVASLALGWEGVVDGFLPLELTLSQMPRRIERGDRHYTLAYKPMGDEDDFSGALLVISDITDEVQRLKHESAQREYIAVFERITKDRNGFVEFFNENEKIVERIVSRKQPVALVMRDIHTVKGNCGIYQVESVANVCHEVESSAEPGCAPADADIERIKLVWSQFAERVRSLLGDSDDDVLEVKYAEWQELVQLAKTAAPHASILRKLERLEFEPTEVRFARIAEQATRLAEKVGKPGLRVELESHGVRLPAEHWASFWASFSHVIRNAIDHGIEAPETRTRAGKSPEGTLVLRSRTEGANYVIELQDDGGGIDWDKVRTKAKALGLPHESPQDLEDALFSDGFSTRDTANDVSGRGVGMAALLQATEHLGGKVQIVSQAKKGTTFRFVVPTAGNDKLPAHSRAPGARPSLNPAPARKRGIRNVG